MTDAEYLRSVGQGAVAAGLLDHPHGDRAIRRLAAMLRGDPPPPEPAPAPPPPRPKNPAPARRAPPPNPAAAADQDRLRTAEGCIHRDPGAGCCPATTCELTGRRVTITDCLQCVADRD